MKMCTEIDKAIEIVCRDYNQNDEFIEMIKKLIQNKMDNNISKDDISSIVEKVDLHDN